MHAFTSVCVRSGLVDVVKLDPSLQRINIHGNKYVYMVTGYGEVAMTEFLAPTPNQPVGICTPLIAYMMHSMHALYTVVSQRVEPR